MRLLGILCALVGGYVMGEAVISVLAAEARYWLMRRDMRRLGRVSRFEVVDSTGRAYVCRPCRVSLSWQDGGRTLKAFIAEGAE